VQDRDLTCSLSPKSFLKRKLSPKSEGSRLCSDRSTVWSWILMRFLLLAIWLFRVQTVCFVSPLITLFVHGAPFCVRKRLVLDGAVKTQKRACTFSRLSQKSVPLVFRIRQACSAHIIIASESARPFVNPPIKPANWMNVDGRGRITIQLCPRRLQE
jgi:hypothetical protein